MLKSMGERLQTTHPTSGGAVTVVSSCCANCVEPPRPQQWGPDLPFFGHAGHADPLLLTKAGDVETNPGPTTLNKKIHVRKQIPGPAIYIENPDSHLTQT